MSVERARDLERAADLVAAGWVQDEEAMDARGVLVPPESPDAAAWCLTAAIRKAAGPFFEPRAEKLIGLAHAELLRTRPDECRKRLDVDPFQQKISDLTRYNDASERVAEDVEGLLRRAAAAERA